VVAGHRAPRLRRGGLCFGRPLGGDLHRDPAASPRPWGLASRSRALPPPGPPEGRVPELRRGDPRGRRSLGPVLLRGERAVNEATEPQCESARRLLPAPASVRNPARRLGMGLLVYFGLIVFFIICFRIFNDMSANERAGTPEPATSGGR